MALSRFSLLNLFQPVVLWGLAILAAIWISRNLTQTEQAWADAEVAKSKSAAQPDPQMKEFQWLIGDWKGIGQPKRGSNTGTWKETAECAWDFSQTKPAIVVQVTDGKHWSQLRLAIDPDTGKPQLGLQPAGGTITWLAGEKTEERWVFIGQSTSGAASSKLTLTVLNENRATLLIEQKQATQSFFTRVAEVAYQRAGTRLDVAGNRGPECIVTGGYGNISVEYKGKTYYVCCTGCRDVFLEDPEAILAEAAAKKQK